MSNSSAITQPPEASTATSRVPPPLSADAIAAIEARIKYLRTELSAASDPARQARLLADIADLEERIHDQPGAARDYLAAYNAYPDFHEPLEALARLLERRRSYKNLGKLIDAFVRAANTPDDKARALLTRAAYEADVTGDLAEAKNSAREATAIEGAPAAEQATAWLMLEVLAGRTGDAATRQEALAERTKFAADPTWRALLLLDCARTAETVGEIDATLKILGEARSIESEATWTATVLLEQILRDHPGADGAEEARSRADMHAAALEDVASLIQDAVIDHARGDALGVPHWVRYPTRVVDAWIRAADARRSAGQLDRAAATLDRGLSVVAVLEGEDARLAEAVLSNARIRIAEQTGDTALAARLAERRLAREGDRSLGAALAMRVAEQAAAEGNAAHALEALSRAIASDPGCLPARALQLDMLADGGDGAAFAVELESFADHLATDDARGRSFLLAAYVWAVRASDVAGAKAALSQAAMFGVPPGTTARVGRTLASIVGDAGWYEEATKRLIATVGAEDEVVSLFVELLRLRRTRGDNDAVAHSLREMTASPRTTWLGLVLEAYMPQSLARSDPAQPSAEARAQAAISRLAGLEGDPDLGRGLALVSVLRSQSGDDPSLARERLRELADRDPSDVLVASYLGDLDRGAADHAAAARVASDAATATATSDAELAATLRLEAGFERWRDGDRAGALEEMDAAVMGAPEAAKVALGWASWGVDTDSLEGRRRALERADRAGGQPRALALERFATEVGEGDANAAATALASINASSEDALGLAAAIAHLVWSGSADDDEALEQALTRVAGCGTQAAQVAAAERVRLTREGGNANRLLRSTRQWHEAGGGLPAALEWLAASQAAGRPEDEARAVMAVAAELPGDARESMLAEAALLQARIDPARPVALVGGASAAARLANLELSPPGCDPRRRWSALASLDGVLGGDAEADALSLSGWSLLAASNVAGAEAAFEAAANARPADLSAWEGLRTCAETDGDLALRARACSELGARCIDPKRGGEFWEEAALVWLDLGDEDRAETAFAAAVERDTGRGVAFDKLFRRVRARKDNDRLLALIARRLEVTDEPQEIQKLFWEQARVLREKGDQEGALNALEHVTMLDPDHVGALALLGEINIRRGRFEEAAASLARLSTLEVAPAKNRVTAGVTAVDLYENKVNQPEKALEVLLTLHRAKLSTLPVRERLARAAARTGSWKEATEILEELMYERPESESRMEAARLAMAIHRDRLRKPQAAAKAIVKLLEEEPADGEALDMLLQTEHPANVRRALLQNARSALLQSVVRRPSDALSVRRLARVAGQLREEALQQAALGVLLALGAGDATADQAFAQLAVKNGRSPQIAVPEALLRSMLAPGDEGPLADLFRLLGPTLAEAFGPTLHVCGVGRRDKVDPRSGLALRNEIATWTGAFGIPEFDLYIGGKDGLAVQGVPGESPALVVGPGVNTPLTPLIRARVAREVIAMVRGTTIARSRDETTLGAIVAASCKLAEVAFEHPPYAMLGEVERALGKAMSRKTRRALQDVCTAVVAQNADVKGWSRRALVSQDRIATIASGDPGIALADALGVTRDKLGTAVRGSARAEELFRFVLSNHYIELRRALGLESGA
jgi:tetratricopeptide (TPR) repeat protein